MNRPFSKLAFEWRDYTTLEPELLADAARVDERVRELIAQGEYPKQPWG